MSIVINSTNYLFIKELGEGGFGKVYHVINALDEKNYAIKEFSIKNETEDSINDIQNEAEILSKFNSDNIVKYYDSFKDEDKFYILMEYCDGKNLKSFLNEYKEKNQLIEENIISNIIRQICLGMIIIHDNNIVHRDLKPENIFINNKMDIKIGDFGISRQLDSFKKYAITIKRAGTYDYMAPEIIYEGIYNEKADIWSLGCLIYELFTLNNYSKSKFFNKIQKIDADVYDSKWQKLIDSLLQDDYNKRPNINQIYKSIFSEDIKIKINENSNGINLNHKKNSSEKILEKKNKQKENNETDNEVQNSRIKDLEKDESVYNLGDNICINKIIGRPYPKGEEVDKSLHFMSKKYFYLNFLF